MNTEQNLRITEIQRFCMHDGPGIRTTVFLKGCPLRCAWCHNPETQSQKAELLFYPTKCIGCASCVALCPQNAHTVDTRHLINREKCQSCLVCVQNCPTGALEACGKETSIADVLEIAERDKAFYGDNGGVTLSGGEPFLQGKAAVALLKACKERGLSTAVETCGYTNANVLRDALPFVDLFLWDLKDTNDDRHKRYTGVSNEVILNNLNMISEAGARIRLRCILVNGINTDEAHYKKIAEIALGIRNLDGVELIPYHAYGGTKATFLGMPDNGNTAWIPEEAQVESAKAVLRAEGVTVL